jgi:protein SCO1/2
VKLLYKSLLLLPFLTLIIGCTTPATHEFGGLVFPTPQPAPDFTLTAAEGQQVSLSDYEGKYVFIYFGYTFCPDVCPITLGKLASVQADLGEQGDQMQVLMVSVDPERDTPEILAEYVGHFDERFVGLTGSPEEIDAAGSAFGLYYQKHEGSAASGYLVDHTARTFLLNPDREIIAAYPQDASSEAVLADMQWLLAQQ